MKGCIYFVNTTTCGTFAATEPEMHTIRTALGSFFLYCYGN